MGKTEKTGEHPGAKKYKKLYKEDYSNLTVKYVRINYDSKHISLEDVEKEVIRILNPICNNEIYKKNWIHEARLELKNS
jgi:peptide methionine sulfoxide reductase MsrA